MDGKVSPGVNSDGREKLTEWRADLKNVCVQGGGLREAEDTVIMGQPKVREY